MQSADDSHLYCQHLLQKWRDGEGDREREKWRDGEGDKEREKWRERKMEKEQGSEREGEIRKRQRKNSAERNRGN